MNRPPIKEWKDLPRKEKVLGVVSLVVSIPITIGIIVVLARACIRAEASQEETTGGCSVGGFIVFVLLIWVVVGVARWFDRTMEGRPK